MLKRVIEFGRPLLVVRGTTIQLNSYVISFSLGQCCELKCSCVAAKRDCEQCDNFENELIHLREDLVDTLNAWVVKAVNSQLVRLYNPNKEPALVFFRHGIPLLYEGKYSVKVKHIFIRKNLL